MARFHFARGSGPHRERQSGTPLGRKGKGQRTDGERGHREPDGEYRGTSTRFQADSRSCPHPGLVHFDVSGNAFQFRWDRDTYVDATIASDGTVSGGAERITLTGRRNGHRIEGDITNGNCGLHFTVTRTP